MQGLLLIDKPSGWTSFDVVNRVRRMVADIEGKKPKHIKVGHTGTLDPLATGLLIILVGKEYTRQAEKLTKADKTYDVTMRLGIHSVTGDEEGAKTHVSDVQPTIEQIRTTLVSFSGSLMQVPPAYSAMKVNGKRAYELARAGKEVTLIARPVQVYANTLTEYAYPFVRFESRVSSGTYIRSLVSDMGGTLGTGAYMSDLRRTSVGRFHLADSMRIDELQPAKLADRLLLL